MHNVHNEKNNYTADLNEVSAERTGVLSATFRFQAWPHMVLESEVILDFEGAFSGRTYFSNLKQPLIIMMACMQTCYQWCKY